MKRILVFALKLAVTFGGIGWVALSMADELAREQDALVEMVRDSDALWLLGALAVTAVSMALSGLQWWILLRRQGIGLSLYETQKCYFVGLFCNTFMPGNAGGDAKKVYDVYRGAKDLAGGFTATLFDRVFGLFMLDVIGMAAGFWMVRTTPASSPALMPIVWIFAAMCLFFAAVFSRRLGALAVRALEALRLRKPAEAFDSIRRRFHLYRDPKLWAGLLTLSGFIQFTRVLIHWMLAVAIGLDAPFVAFLYFVPLLGVVSALPISVGGFGPREALAQSLFALVAFSPVESFVLTELSVLVVILVSLPGGIAFLTAQTRPAADERHMREKEGEGR